MTSSSPSKLAARSRTVPNSLALVGTGSGGNGAMSITHKSARGTGTFGLVSCQIMCGKNNVRQKSVRQKTNSCLAPKQLLEQHDVKGKHHVTRGQTTVPCSRSKSTPNPLPQTSPQDALECFLPNETDPSRPLQLARAQAETCRFLS